MAVDYEKLDQEADELIKQNLNGTPPENPDTAPADEKADEAGSTAPEAPEPETAASDSQADSQAEPAPGKPDTDELDGLTVENARERIRNAQARMTRATMEAAEYRRALADEQQKSRQLQSEVDRLTAELNARPAPPASESVDGIATLEQLREDYPTIIEPLLQTLKRVQARVDELEGSVKKSVETERQKAERAAAEAHFNAIRQAHPDFQQIVNTDDFQGWLDRQPRTYRIILFGDGIPTSDYVHGGSAREVIEVFDHYKQAIGSAKRTEAAREVASPTLRRTARPANPNNGRPTFTREQISRMSPEEFAKHEAEIDAAMAEGRVI